MTNWLSTVLLIAILGTALVLVSYSRIRKELKLLIYAAVALRILGAGLRYYVLTGFYGGFGDQMRYYEIGLGYAEQFQHLDFSVFTDRSQRFGGSWWGTQFVFFVSGGVLWAIGPSLIGEFIVFSLFGFGGLVGFALAFRRSYPQVSLWRYLRWLWLFPSLWFWPSSVGKEAIVLLGIGVAVAGFVGIKGRIHWGQLAVGLMLVFAIRPQVAAVVILAFILGQWLAQARQWTAARVVQGLFILGIGLAGISVSLQYAGVGSFDVEGLQSYIETDPARRVGGGSEIEAVQVGWRGVPLALVNILFRPFPWAADNIMVLFSSLEVVLFWAIVWYRRRNLWNSLRHWRSDRLLRVAIPFILVYAITLGLLVTNLGVIARQRVFLFPFLFILIEAVPAGTAEVLRRRGTRVTDRRHEIPVPAT